MPKDAEARVVIGQLLDERYRIIARVGSGGMGEVFLAEHVNLGRQDALKILHRELAQDPEFVARFRREARATNRLHHPNIVAVHDFGQLSDGRFYLAMEYVAGERLDAVLKRGPLTVARAVHILAQLADAVDHAHQRGVVHRDLKPENLLLVEHRGRSDVLKVLDFGVAKIVTGDAKESVSLSHKGKVYGTPAYMAPEQFSGGVSDPRVDLYAIGCIGYTLLVGEPPFSGHMLQLLEAHATRQPERPSSKRSSARIPSALDDIVLRLLAKRAAERFQTGRELFQALERLSEPEERSPSGRRAHPSLRMRAVRRDEVGATDFSHHQPKPDVPDGVAATDQVSSAGVFERALKEVVRSLAQAIADLDDAPVPVLIALMRLRQLDDDLAFVEARQHAHEALSDDLDSAARAREGSLRFALGELHYHKAHAAQRGATPDPAIDAHIARVEAQVAKVHEKLDGEQTLVTDSSIALAAERHNCEEELAAGYRALERLVDQYLPRVENNPQVTALAGRLRSIRAAVPKQK